MKKIIISTFLCALTFSGALGQKISKKEAQQFLEKAWGYVKASDSLSFINLYRHKDMKSNKEVLMIPKQQISDNFNAMKEYLDTALLKNLEINNIDIQKRPEGMDVDYWIKAWFKYDEHYYKGFGFYLVYIDKKWVINMSPSTSEKTTN